LLAASANWVSTTEAPVRLAAPGEVLAMAFSAALSIDACGTIDEVWFMIEIIEA
jgi:hypothetical protein